MSCFMWNFFTCVGFNVQMRYITSISVRSDHVVSASLNPDWCISQNKQPITPCTQSHQLLICSYTAPIFVMRITFCVCRCCWLPIWHNQWHTQMHDSLLLLIYRLWNWLLTCDWWMRMITSSNIKFGQINGTWAVGRCSLLLENFVSSWTNAEVSIRVPPNLSSLLQGALFQLANDLYQYARRSESGICCERFRRTWVVSF